MTDTARLTEAARDAERTALAHERMERIVAAVIAAYEQAKKESRDDTSGR